MVAAFREGTGFATFAGNETFLIYQQGRALRDFCAFEILDDEPAWRRFEDGMIRPLARAARAAGLGLVADTLVWRAAPDPMARLGYGAADLIRVNRGLVARTRAALAGTPSLVISADVGPRGDGYAVEPGAPVAPEAARAYHARQLAALAGSDVDVVTALTMTSPGEAIGLVLAARDHGLPVLVSVTIETDGRLPDGTRLGDFIHAVDDATSGEPLFYMVNCAHPDHLAPVLDDARDAGAGWLGRLRGFRANASRRSHAELDAATELDRGEVAELAARVAALAAAHGLDVVGGCCGTDAEHVAAIAAACAQRPPGDPARLGGPGRPAAR